MADKLPVIIDNRFGNAILLAIQRISGISKYVCHKKTITRANLMNTVTHSYVWTKEHNRGEESSSNPKIIDIKSKWQYKSQVDYTLQIKVIFNCHIIIENDSITCLQNPMRRVQYLKEPHGAIS